MRATRWAIAAERAWRAAVWMASALALWLALALSGVLDSAPGWVRVTALLGSMAAGAYGLWREARWPAREEALARLDADARQPGLAGAISDKMAAGTGDALAENLWRAHKARQARALNEVQAAAPDANLPRYDKRALRIALVLAAVVAAIAAGDKRAQRLAVALDFSGARSVVASRLDIWIDPPGYTGRPPLVLAGESANRSATDNNVLSAPAGSILVLRASPPEALAVDVSGAAERSEPEKAPDQASAQKPRAKKPEGEQRYILKGETQLGWKDETGARRLKISIIPDQPPTIALLEQPKANARGALTLAYKLADDYGVARAQAQFDLPERDGRPVTGKPLYDPPQAALQPGPEAGGLGEAKTTVDLSEHPFAGARARLTLRAEDEGGGMGESAPIFIFLPERRFSNPLARALIEQRRNLALEPQRKDRVLTGLAGLMIAPEVSGMKQGVYLGLRFAVTKIRRARTDEALREAVDYLWEMALALEGGDLSNEERGLREAAEKLREALKNGASPEELRKRIDELRAALDKFTQALREQRKNGGQSAQSPPNPSARNIRPEDLQDMMKKMEEMAERGDNAEAQALLDQLQDIMENLRTARPQESDPQMRQMDEALRDLDDLARRQQDLRDDTYQDSQSQKQGQKQPSQQQPSPQQSDKEGQDKSLRDRQTELRRALDSARKKMGGGKMGGGNELEAADEAMQDAEKNLKPGGDRRAALDAQGRALENLRKGAEKMAQAMRQASGGEGAEGQQGADSQGERDPLGRMPNGRDPNRRRFDPQATSPSARARQVLEELRRRLGERARPQDELDYLERLIRRY